MYIGEAQTKSYYKNYLIIVNLVIISDDFVQLI